MGLSLTLPHSLTNPCTPELNPYIFSSPFSIFQCSATCCTTTSLYIGSASPDPHVIPTGSLEKSFLSCLAQRKAHSLYWHKLNTRFLPRCWRFSRNVCSLDSYPHSCLALLCFSCLCHPHPSKLLTFSLLKALYFSLSNMTEYNPGQQILHLLLHPLRVRNPFHPKLSFSDSRIQRPKSDPNVQV